MSNRATLAAEVRRAERRVAAVFGAESGDAPATPPTPDPELEQVFQRFSLTAIERDIMILALAAELSPRIGSMYAHFAPHAAGRPTVATLAMVLGSSDDVPGAIAAALAPGSRLVRNALVVVDDHGSFPNRVVRIPDAVWARLAGVPVQSAFSVHPRVVGGLDRDAVSSETRDRIARAVMRAGEERRPCVFVLDGFYEAGIEELARAVSGEMGRASISVRDREGGLVLNELRRELLWHDAALVMPAALVNDAIVEIVRELDGLLVITGGRPAASLLGGLTRIDVEVTMPSSSERVAAWHACLRDDVLAADVSIDAFSQRTRFGPARIRTVVGMARERAAVRDGVIRAADLRAACRRSAGAASPMLELIEGNRSLEDLVVSMETRRELELACAWARHARTAFGELAERSVLADHEGLACLFHGASGTGKTLAARAMAGTLECDLVRVDLSQVVNKYVGETEKNLRLAFEEAEAVGALLFFDEADALFGRRTEVKDAHDRYANIETSYLLQRLESHPGICILATNLRNNLDAAFLRRIQVVIEFSKPGARERELLWTRHLPRTASSGHLDLADLGARFEITGGEIRNAAATALLLAAVEQKPVATAHLAIGAWRELRKAGRLIKPDDLGPWRDAVIAYASGESPSA